MLDLLDWIIIIIYLSISLSIGIYWGKKENNDIKSYFLGGGNNTWWLAGLSMVATTFAADTPLAVTEIVSKNGISGNWIWWNMLISGVLTTFFFAQYWKRAGITTDLELIHLRYSGTPATILRVFRALYLGVFMNAIIIGWVNFAMLKILMVFFDLSSSTALGVLFFLMLFTAFYSSIAGLKGIMVADALQFTIAMLGCIVMAFYVVYQPNISGIETLTQKVPPHYLHFFPTSENLPMSTILSYLLLNWWAIWYPGAEPGGGGYVAQRMMSTKSEKEAILSSLFFQFAHYALRPWPWIIIGLCAYVLYPQPENYPISFVLLMKNYLPIGLKGLLLVAFLSAYMSTLSTQLNWGTSYVINDGIHVLFNFSEKTLLRISKITVFILMLFSLWISTQLESVKQAWEFLLQCGAGIGFVLIMRWFWWRISAWSEITATVAPAILLFLAYTFDSLAFLKESSHLYLLVLFSVVITLIVTYLTPPTDNVTLIKFYQKIKPIGFWGQFSSQHSPTNTFLYSIFAWLLGVLGIYAGLFAIGYCILHQYLYGLLSGLLAISCWYAIQKIYFTKV
ncbi:MAG: sodium:proline symporter [Bacteroidia bacterium]|nr:MAG: sodium:proline symporter [Bacteroidia bacterium]